MREMFITVGALLFFWWLFATLGNIGKYEGWSAETWASEARASQAKYQQFYDCVDYQTIYGDAESVRANCIEIY